MIIGGSEVGTGGTWTPFISPLLRPSWMQLDRSLYARQDIMPEGGSASNSLWRPSPPYSLFVYTRNLETWIFTKLIDCDMIKDSVASENVKTPIHWDRYNSASFQKQMRGYRTTYKCPYCKPGTHQKLYVIVIKEKKIIRNKGRE